MSTDRTANLDDKTFYHLYDEREFTVDHTRRANAELHRVEPQLTAVREHVVQAWRALITATQEGIWYGKEKLRQRFQRALNAARDGR